MLDRILAPIALIFMAGSLGIIIWRVPDPVLGIVVVLAVGCCAFDFWRSIYRRGPGGR